MQNEQINSLKANNLEISFSFFDIFKKFNIKNIILNNPDFDIYSKKYNFDNFNKFFNKSNDFFVYINHGKINYINVSSMYSKTINEINGFINFNGDELDSNLSFLAGDIKYNLISTIKSKKNEYKLDLKVNNEQSKITYNGIMNINNNIIENITGKVLGSGVKFNQFLKLFCFECADFEKEQVLNSTDKFELKADTIYNNSDKIFKIEDIELKQSNNTITANILYNSMQRKTNMRIEIDQVNILEKFDFKADNQFDFIRDYFFIINGFDFDLEVFINKLQFAEYYISNFASSFSSNNGIMNIKQIKGNFLDQHDLNIMGEVTNNQIRNQIALKILIPLKENKNDFISFEINLMTGVVFLNNLQVKIKNILELSSNLEIRSNTENTDIYGQVNFNNSDLNSVIESLQKLSDKNEMGVNETGGKFLNKLLLLTRQLKLNANVNFILTNNRWKQTNIEKMLFALQIDDNGIMLDADLLDKNIFNIHAESNLFWNALKPNLSLNINSSMINIPSLTKLLGLDLVKFILNREEFKATNNQNLWHKIDVNMKSLVGFDFQARVLLSNILFKNFKIDNLASVITAANNDLKIRNLNATIDKAKIDISGNIDPVDQLFSLIFSIDSLRLNYFGQNDNSYLSSSGKVNSKGFNITELIKNLNSTINYLFYNFRVDNLNLNLFVDKFGNINNESQLITLSENSVISGNTVFNSIKGMANIKGGTINSNLELSANKFNGAGSFNIITGNSALAGLTRFAFINRTNNNPIIADLEWGGNIYNINKNFNLEKLKAELP